jgi:hypothetical protein
MTGKNVPRTIRPRRLLTTNSRVSVFIGDFKSGRRERFLKAPAVPETFPLITNNLPPNSRGPHAHAVRPVGIGSAA